MTVYLKEGRKLYPWPAKPSKYKNRKVVKNGETFDSVKEYERFLVLRDMEKRDTIRNLVRQPEFRLEVNGQLICKYRADFAYDRRPAGRRVVEDVKGYETPEFKIKFKLAKALFPDLEFITS